MNKREIEETLINLQRKIERIDDDFLNYKTTPSLTEMRQDNNIKNLKENIKTLSSKVNELTDEIEKLQKDSKDSEKLKEIKWYGLEKLSRTRANSIFTREQYLEFENECLLKEVDKIKSENIYLKNVIQEINQLSGDTV
ncbi:hypothetical protein [Oceanobacillus oncorhynchi]|uniref:hypothetical protein n=1 Tax=Oceanobacillus oncorhynchi TaxID=545501 RepID=UPI0034D3F2BD